MVTKRLITIIRDSREKKVPYVLQRLDNTQVIRRKLDAGDYSVDGYEDLLMIERKDSVDELAGNFTRNRKRFAAEWERAQTHLVRKLVVQGRYTDILYHNYRSELAPYSFCQTLAAWELKYRFSTTWCDSWAEVQLVIADYCRQVTTALVEKLRGYEDAEQGGVQE